MNWMFWPISFVLIFYALMSGYMLYRPALLLATGIAVCVIAAMMSTILGDWIFLRFPAEKAYIKTAMDICSLSLGAMGGGIISAACAQKARLMHFATVESIRNQIGWKKEQILNMESSIKRLGECNDEDAYRRKIVVEKIIMEMEIIKLEDKLEKLKPVA